MIKLNNKKGECLVYLENQGKHPDVTGITYVGRILKKDKDSVNVQLLSDYQGNQITDGEKVVVKNTAIVSDRKYSKKRDYFYHFPSSRKFCDKNICSRYNVESDNFVNVLVTKDPVQNTSRSAFGTGIYGFYIDDKNINNYYDNIQSNNTYQEVNKIQCSRPYFVQDLEHSESLTVASITTSRYIDFLLAHFEDEAEDLVSKSSHLNIVNLWNIVFYRTNNYLSENDFTNLMINYINDYHDPNLHYKDSITNKPLFVLPINYIMNHMGFDSIIGSDNHTNAWYSGCVNFNFEKSNVYNSGKALY